MTEPNEQYAYFTIIGDFDPADISKLVGVTPTEAWANDDINPRTQLERRFSRWSLYSRLERSRELEAHIADVIEQLGAKKNDSWRSLHNMAARCSLWRTSGPAIRVSI